MAYKLPLLDYKNLIKLPDGSYKGIQETVGGFVVQDLHKGTNFGVRDSLDGAVLLAHSYGLNLHSPAVQGAPQPARVSTPADSPMGVAIKSLATPPTPTPMMSFEAYCALFTNPNNKSGVIGGAILDHSSGGIVLSRAA